MINTKFTNDLLTKQLEKLKEEALKPMSIIEIQEKFNLSFPFKVKRVKSSINPEFGMHFELTTIEAIKKHYHSGYCTTNRIEIEGKWYSQCADVQDYILYEEN